MKSEIMTMIIILLYALRILLCLTPQTGYLHPDEFFQFTEPVVGDILKLKNFKTWEFTTLRPIRCIFFPILLSLPFYFIEKYAKIIISPYSLVVIPRFIFTLVSFVSDFILYKLCLIENRSDYKWPLIAYSSSYLSLCYMTHTFTNSLETLLFAFILWIVSLNLKKKKSKLNHVFGCLLCLGFFNRPTFSCFAFVPIMFWLLVQKKSFGELILSLFPSFLITFITLVTLDTFYYNPKFVNRLISKVLSQSFSFDDLSLDQVVVTPFNFIDYNINSSNLKNHGLHSRFQNVLVNIPFAFGILGLIAYAETIDLILRKKKIKSFINLMHLMTFWVSLIILSIIPHQEPRFLIPSLILLSYLYGSKLKSSKFLLFIWITVNLVLTIFYGYIHQAGLMRSLFWLNKNILTKTSAPIDIIIARTYIPPRHILNISKNDKRVTIHDLSIDNFPNSIESKFKEIKKVTKNSSRNLIKYQSNIFLILPSCLSDSLFKLGSKLKLTEIKLVKQFFPHFTQEDLDFSLFRLDYSSLKIQFSLNIYQITI